MLLNLVKYKKNTITVSSEVAPTSLVAFNTAKNTISWTPANDPDWMNINFYELTSIDYIKLTYTGSCTSMIIEYSLDALNWEVLTDAFSPDDVEKTVEIDYADLGSNVEASFVRIFVAGLTTFVLNSLSIKSDITFQNTEFLSHMITGLYSEVEISLYPWLPSFTRIFLEMLENKETKDLKLFDSDDFSSLAIAKNVVSKLVELTASDVPLDAMIYVWDWDEQISTLDFGILIGTDFDFDGDGLYWEFQYNQLDDDSYVWYNVTDGANTQDDPSLVGKTGIEVQILDADTATEIASKTVTEITGTNIVASSALGVMTITNGIPGLRISITDNDTTVDVSEIMKLTQTLNPLTQVSNTYQHAGSYVPKLLLNYTNYQLEFVKAVTTT